MSFVLLAMILFSFVSSCLYMVDRMNRKKEKI